MTLHTDEIKRKRSAVANAIHTMHADRQIIVSSALADALQFAWDEYDHPIIVECYLGLDTGPSLSRYH